MTGNRFAHPLLISTTALDLDFRMKATNHAFLLLALLPIPKFINKDDQKVLQPRMFHSCLDIILEPLKKAAEIGTMMRDPLGSVRYCYTPLAAYIVDTPEAAMLAGVAGKTSHVTMAYYKEFGDAFCHEARTSSTTLKQLRTLEASIDPWDLQAYLKEAKKFRLNGVHRPFWRDWALSDPSVFLTPEPLHHWHRMFWDHDAQWCIKAVGAAELDFRYSILQPRTGFQHFHNGISQLKQVTGRDHRDIQRYIIPIIADAVSKKFLIAIRALADFRYLAQCPELDDTVCSRIKDALAEFHDHKQVILSESIRTGRKANWHIPKLEFLQSVAPSICANGVPMQWSADVTEHAHITEVKDPARASNNQSYELQICRFLDRAEKCRLFDLSTSIHEAWVDFRSIHNEKPSSVDDNDYECVSDTASLINRLNSPLLDRS